MGLDTTHDCWHGAYSAFSRWRDALAKAAGYEMETVRDDMGMSWQQPKFINWNALQDENYQGVWDQTPEEPLVLLFAHSDCDGAIYPRDAKPLSDRLEELLPRLEGDGGGHIGNYRQKTQKFIDGLRLAVSRDEVVEFRLSAPGVTER